jgi:hypothetical protein
MCSARGASISASFRRASARQRADGGVLALNPWEQGPRLGHRETGLLGEPDDAQGSQDLHVVAPPPANPPRGGQESDALVVAQGRRADTRPARRLPDREGCHGSP